MHWCTLSLFLLLQLLRGDERNHFVRYWDGSICWIIHYSLMVHRLFVLLRWSSDKCIKTTLFEFTRTLYNSVFIVWHDLQNLWQNKNIFLSKALTICLIYHFLFFVHIPGTSEESNAVSHHQQQPPQPQVVYSSASKSEVLLSFWLLSAVMSLSCALRD